MYAAKSFHLYSVLEPPERDNFQVKYMPGVQAMWDGAKDITVQANKHLLSAVFIFRYNQCT